MGNGVRNAAAGQREQKMRLSQTVFFNRVFILLLILTIPSCDRLRSDSENHRTTVPTAQTPTDTPSPSLTIETEIPPTTTPSPTSTRFPQQEWIAFIGEDNNLWLIHPDGSDLTQVTADGSVHSNVELKWSPDGSTLAFTRVSATPHVYELLLLSIDSFELRTFSIDLGGGFDWSTDSKLIVYDRPTFFNEETFKNEPLQEDDGFWILDIESGEYSLLITFSMDELNAFPISPDWSPSGEYISFVLPCFEPQCTRTGLLYYEDPNINEISLFEIFPAGMLNCDWNPSASQLACNSESFNDTGLLDEHILIVDSPGGEPLHIPKPNSMQQDVFPLWSPDGSRIAFSSYIVGTSADRSIFIIDTENLVRQEIGNGFPRAWSPDGRFLAITVVSEIYILNVETGEFVFLDEGWQIAWQPIPPVP